MLEKVAKKISNWLVMCGEISVEDKSLYEYAAFNLIFTSIPIGLFLLFCITNNLFINGFIIVFTTLTIRRYAGGYHARKPIVCVCISSFMMIMNLYISLHLKNLYIQCIILFFSTILLWILSPIDSENRRLDENEKKYSKSIVRKTLCLTIGAYVALIFLSKTEWACCLCLSVFVSAILQVIVVVEY